MRGSSRRLRPGNGRSCWGLKSDLSFLPCVQKANQMRCFTYIKSQVLIYYYFFFTEFHSKHPALIKRSRSLSADSLTHIFFCSQQCCTNLMKTSDTDRKWRRKTEFQIVFASNKIQGGRYGSLAYCNLVRQFSCRILFHWLFSPYFGVRSTIPFCHSFLFWALISPVFDSVHL